MSVNITIGGVTRPAVGEEIPAAERTLAEAKEVAMQAAAERRWRAEIGGATIDETFIDTSPRTQEVFDRAFAKAKEDENYEIAAFKFGNGQYTTMNTVTIFALANGIEAHIQACFANNKVLDDAINACTTVAEVEAVDLESGWP